MTAELQTRLANFLQQAFPDRQKLQVSDVQNLTAGWESELYAFNLSYTLEKKAQNQSLVLRLYHGSQAGDKAYREFQGLQSLREQGYPVPGVLLVEVEQPTLGRPFLIMDHISGQGMWSLLEQADGREEMRWLDRFCALFVRLHQLDWQPFSPDPAAITAEGPYYFVDQWLEEARHLGQRYPLEGFQPLLDWLAARRGSLACSRPAVVHGDFHPNNILVQPEGACFVIDWTGIGVSDARLDLAWTLTLAASYGSWAWREAIVKNYERMAGQPLDHLETFETFAYARRLFEVTVSLSAGPDQLGMRPEARQLIHSQLGAARRVYGWLLERTGIRLPSFENLTNDPN